MSANIPAAVRREVAERYGLTPGETRTLKCHYCDEATEAYWPIGYRGKPTYWPMFGRGFALDHVVPRARGGQHEASNLVLSCTPCNSRKRDHLIPVAAPQLLPEWPATENGATPQGKGREGIRKGSGGEGFRDVACGVSNYSFHPSHRYLRLSDAAKTDELHLLGGGF